MGLNTRIILKLSIIFFIAYITIFYLNKIRTDKLIENEIRHEIANIKTNFDSSLYYFKRSTNNTYHFISNNKKIVNIMEQSSFATNEEKSALRKELLTLLEKPYERIKNNGGDIFHFVLPDNKSFLRMHQNEKYGDDLSSVRDIYSKVHKTKKPIFVFENGNLNYAFRYVYPLFKKEKYIGAIEISYDSSNIQRNLLEINKIHNHLIVKKDLFLEHNYKKEEIAKKYIQSIEHKDYLFNLVTYENHKNMSSWEKKLISPLKDTINRSVNLGEEFGVYTSFDEKIKTIVFLPIEDIKNEVKAYLVTYNENNYIKEILKNYYVFNIILFISLGGLFIFIYFILDQKKILKKQVEKRTKELNELNENLEYRVKKEIKKNNKNKEIILKQQKTVALGEMMDAIAHQWKQPLSIILMNVQNFSLKNEFEGKVTTEDIKELEKETKLSVDHLINTIDHFRSFFRPNQELSTINIDEITNTTLHLIKNDLIKNEIEIKKEIDENLSINCIPNEFKHVLINIITNAKDAFNEKKIENRVITIKAYKETQYDIIEICDNAGGIKEEIIDKIFISNFTTKKDTGGTGIGLYLVKQILDKIFASIEVKNTTNGASFKIKLNNK